MKINMIDYYLDGGTAQIATEAGVFYVDRRLKTETPGVIYDKHPDENGAKIVKGVREELMSALRVYGGEEMYDKECINILLKDMGEKI